MRRIEPFLASSFQRGVGRNELPVFEDTDFIGENVHFEDAPSRGAGHTVEIAANADHAFVRSPPLEPQQRPVGRDGKAFSDALSSAKASLTTLLVVACTRGLATVSSQ